MLRWVAGGRVTLRPSVNATINYTPSPTFGCPDEARNARLPSFGIIRIIGTGEYGCQGKFWHNRVS